MAIRSKLSTVLGERRLKMTDVARATGLARNTVLGLYHDRVQKVDYRVLDKLCEYLGCQVGDLLVYVPTCGEEKEPQER
ncbi:MAG TPA: helix-turn-helix transcriptional regulator [Firmicutes bacterium]|nr:helix-turn-helix transcriptional regulator [Bacillota bacterium]